MSNKQEIYDRIFSLIEEELYQRLSASNYRDSAYDGSKHSICGSSNLDISNDELSNSSTSNSFLIGGSKRSRVFKRKFLPGKFDVVKYSHILPLNIAIKGSIERQKLFLKESAK